MSAILYYLAGARQKPNLETVRSWGLGSVIDAQRPSSALVKCGPDGGSGMLVCEGRLLGDTSLAYDGDGQRWQKMPPVEGRPELWLGAWDGFVPGPADLVRGGGRPGAELELVDGSRWRVPRLRQYDIEQDLRLSPLPQRMKRDEAGEWLFAELLPQFEPLEKIAVDWINFKLDNMRRAARLLDGDDAGDDEEPMVGCTVDLGEFVNSACTLLGVNYRVGADEIDFLGLFVQETMADILDLAVAWDEYLEWMEAHAKKKLQEASGGSTTSAGGAG